MRGNLAKFARQNFRNFWSAKRTITGYESMNMMASHGRVSRPCGIAMLIRQGQIKNVKRNDVLGQIDFIHSLFEIAV
jgi:transposase, IS6 family